MIIIVDPKDEEELLTRELPGYAEYKQKVKYRILPFIWQESSGIGLRQFRIDIYLQ